MGQRARAVTGQELNPEKWVFVVGCYNSGTTLLASLLGAHPDVTLLPREGVELCDALPRPEELGWPRMWLQCEAHVRIPAEEQAARARRIKKQWSPYAAGAGIVAEKSIANITRLEFLARHFTPAYFIYVLRDGYAVAEGIRRRAKPRDWGREDVERYTMEQCAAQWAASDAYWQRSRDKLPHLLELRYEALAEDPPRVLDEISTFLDVPPFPADVATRSWEIHRVRSGIRNMNADAIERLSPADIDAIEHRAGDTLRRHGYGRPTASTR